MKSKLPIALLITAFFYSFLTNAQDIIKINLSSLALTNISLQDEYILNGHSSIALGASWMPKRGIPSTFTEKDSAKNDLSAVRFGGFSVTPEYRYYFSGNAPKGFYVAGYFRYSKYTLDNFSYNYTNDNNVTNHYALTGDWTVAGVGLMIGSQWKLGEHMVFDWWIIGGAFGKNEGSFSGTGPLSAKDQADLKNNIATTDIPVGTLKYTVTSNSASITYDSGLPAIRGMGFCLGYNFGGGNGSGHSYHRH